MAQLSRSEYLALYRELATYDDVVRIHEQRGMDKDLLLIIYTHRVTRDATKRYYSVLNHTREMLNEWNHGKSYTEIARKWNFPPVLIAQMIEKTKNTPRKVFWDGFRRPSEISDIRIRREVEEAMVADWIYSPKGGEIQRERGIRGEDRLHNWLEKHHIGYRTEKELRGSFTKTPDALLSNPIWIDGQEVQWIESKANFGDEVEVGRNLRKQLIPYVQLFGQGIVVYWFGYVTGQRPPPKGIMVLDGDEFEQKAPSKPGDAPPVRVAATPVRAPTEAKPPRRPSVDRSAYF
ncbi:MAG: C15orf41 family protein [Candidatus Thermoplasmatota archaeon]|nr:C15orf41 family protein [Candidatus Thermoplasmatota archaeon]